jgi:hypothetical protein
MGTVCLPDATDIVPPFHQLDVVKLTTFYQVSKGYQSARATAYDQHSLRLRSSCTHHRNSGPQEPITVEVIVV